MTDSEKPVPGGKKWRLALFLLLVAFFMYGSVMYRIYHYGARPL